MRNQEYKVFDGQTWQENVLFNFHTLQLEKEGKPLVVTPIEVRLYTGFKDRIGRKIYEGDKVSFYYKGGTVQARIIFHESSGMFCLLWPDGYINQYPLNPEKYTLVEE